jgi:two-component system KDP operon response regulator KdpE
MTEGSAGRLLLVDDEVQIIRSLTPALVAAGYTVDAAEDGASALDRAASEPYDILILDLGLPDMDGKDLIARIRTWSEVPIVVLSARDMEAEKVAALDLGADDFVNKPVAMRELLARLRANLRGSARRFAAQPSVTLGDLQIDFTNRRAWVEGDMVKLTPREFDLLRILARHEGRVVTHRQVMAAVWGGDSSVNIGHLRVLVAQLRQKLEAEPSSPRNLLTAPGVGYRLYAGNASPTE